MHICARSLSNAAHQLSSGCHECRQPGRGIYSQSIQNGPCHFYWISHQQKGQLRWWVLVGGQLKETVPTRQTAPAECALPTVWARTCRWHHVSALNWMLARQVVCFWFSQADRAGVIKYVLNIFLKQRVSLRTRVVLWKNSDEIWNGCQIRPEISRAPEISAFLGEKRQHHFIMAQENGVRLLFVYFLCCSLYFFLCIFEIIKSWWMFRHDAFM